MPAPPMNQTIVLHSTQRDAAGNPVLNRNGQVIRTKKNSRARVKYSGEQIFTANGEETEAVLELVLPSDLEIREGDLVEWIDDFGKTITGPVAKLGEARNYGGLVVYFRKAWTT